MKDKKKYFDKMETAFGVQDKHDNMTDEEKNQFGDVEEVGLEKKGITKLGDSTVQSKLTKTQNDSGKDATDYYKSILDKMAKNQKTNVDIPDKTKIERSADNALTKEEFEPKKYNIEDDEHEMYYGSGMEGVKYDTEGTDRQEEFDERVDELNDDDGEGTTYGKLKKDGEKYKKYRYGDEKYDESEDEYQETPRVRTTVKEGFDDEELRRKQDTGEVEYDDTSPKEISKFIDFVDKYGKPVKMDSDSLFPQDKAMLSIFPASKIKELMIKKDSDKESGILLNKINQEVNLRKGYVYRSNKNENKNMKYADVIKENIFKANGKLVSKEQVLTLANKVPNRVKIDETVFAVTDGDNSYRLIWEGEKNGKAVITHNKDTKLVSEDMGKMRHLMGFNTNDAISTKKTITENGDEAFKRMYNQVKNKKQINEVAFSTILAIGAGVMVSGAIIKKAKAVWDKHVVAKRYEETGETKNMGKVSKGAEGYTSQGQAEATKDIIFKGYKEKETGKTLWGLDVTDSPEEEGGDTTSHTIFFTEDQLPKVTEVMKLGYHPHDGGISNKKISRSHKNTGQSDGPAERQVA